MAEGANVLSRRGFIAASVSALSYGRILGANDRANIGIIGCGGRGLLTVKKTNRIVQCGTQIRSYPHSVAARQFVTAGNLGKILKVEQSRNAYKPYWHGFGRRMVYNPAKRAIHEG